MPQRHRRRIRDRGLVGWLIAAAATLLLTAVIPMTTSAFTATIANTANTATAKARFTCADTFAGDRRKQRAFFEFAFDEPAGATTARDSSDAGNPGAYRGSNAKDAASPTSCPFDSGGAYRLDGSSSRVTTSRYFDPIQTSFTVEAWFTTTSPGKILGFQSSIEDASYNYDKHLYVAGSGRLVYGIYNGGTQTLFSPGTVTDGTWHHAVGTTGPKGSRLYLDGVEVAAEESFTTAEYFGGYWRIGQGRLASWPDTPSDVDDAWFRGSIRFAAAYPYLLSADEVASEWSIGRPGARTGGVDPTADPTASVSASQTASADPTATATATATASTLAPAPKASVVQEAPEDTPATSSPQQQPDVSSAG